MDEWHSRRQQGPSATFGQFPAQSKTAECLPQPSSAKKQKILCDFCIEAITYNQVGYQEGAASILLQQKGEPPNIA
jgi:hypothetical protein